MTMLTIIKIVFQNVTSPHAVNHKIVGVTAIMDFSEFEFGMSDYITHPRL